MLDAVNPIADRRPLLIIVVGRQRVGKTSLLNTTVQFVRSNGGELVVWNADRMNRTYSLSIFHPDALEPSSSEPEDGKKWLEERFAHQVKHRYDAVLDIGGGTTPLSQLVEEVPIVRALERLGVRVLVIHVIGAEMADLDYLERFLADDLLAPEATMIVLNDGLVLTGRSADSAFENVRKHPAIQGAMAAGAQVRLFPKLSCMSQVTDRHLTFADAMNGVNKPGMPPLSFFDQERVSVWWERELPKFFGSVPPLWLPEMPGFMRPSAQHADTAPPPTSKKRSGTDG